jgi:hypothetical protein
MKPKKIKQKPFVWSKHEPGSHMYHFVETYSEMLLGPVTISNKLEDFPAPVKQNPTKLSLFTPSYHTWNDYASKSKRNHG